MTRRSSSGRPPGAWRRFALALATLAAVLVGVPALLLACSRAGLDSVHPFPRIGPTEEIKRFFERDLTPTEMAPIALRALLIVAWALWLGMVVSVASSILEARGNALRAAVPQFAMFGGLGRWIAAGLTAVSSLAPSFVSAASLASPRPFTISSASATSTTVIETPVAAGFARVQRGESIETFARRTLGDESRWPEIWDLNRDRSVGQGDEVWSVAWKLSAGWDLRLPGVSVVDGPGGVGPGERYSVVPGDSYWSIAQEHLPSGAPDSEVWAFAQALMHTNSPGLGYTDPAMLQAGDVVHIVPPPLVPPLPGDTAEPGPRPSTTHVPTTHLVVAGDSYWEIAEDTLGSDASPRDVLELTNDLMDLNGPLLGYPVRPLIRPGDTVLLQAPTPVVVPTADALPPSGVDELEIGEITIPSVPTALPVPTSTMPPSTTAVPTTIDATTTTTTTTTPDLAADPPADDTVDSDRPSPLPIGFGEAGLLATGVIALLGARRRARLRAAEPPARLPQPRPGTAATERQLRRLEDGERLLRVDIALRAAAATVADSEHRVVALRSAPDGTLELLTSAPVALPAPWVGSASGWRLPASVAIDELATPARTVGAPCIAITELGVDEQGWDLLVDVEALGVLAVDAEGPPADSVVRAIAVGLATSEFAEVAHLVGVGFEDTMFLGHRQAQAVADVDEGLELAATLVGATTASKRNTFALRSRHTGGEVWEPAVVMVASGEAAGVTPTVLSSISSRGGVALVVAGAVSGAGWTLRPDGAMWTLDPLGVRLRPVGVDTDDLIELVDVIDGAVAEGVGAHGHASPPHALLVDAGPFVAGEDPDGATAPPGVEPVIRINGNRHSNGDGNGNGHGDSNGHHGAARSGSLNALPDMTPVPSTPFAEPSWSIMVKLMGSIEVIDAAGAPARFERSKTLELLTWLVTHRDRSTRSGARTALWDQAVRDATFANVVSEARRTLARHVEPPEGDEWLRRTMTDELSLHELVVGDDELVRARYTAASRQSDPEALRTLKPAVELIRELPFAGTTYLWPDAEGIASNLVLLATNVTAEYARRALSVGEIGEVFWSTGRGLNVLAGQEALIALRMRAHAEAGDLSGVRHEWESYERVITADPWSDGEAAPKLVALRRELLSH